jgi:hypothetical protein
MTAYRVILFIGAIVFCVFGYIGSPAFTLFYPAIYVLGLCFHLLFDKEKIHLFITVFSLFIISSFFQVYFYFNKVEGVEGAFQYLYTVQLFWILGFILIFLKMIKDHPLQLRFTKWSFLIPVIIGLDIFLAIKIIDMIELFNLSSYHIIYTFLYTILKMVLMSIGLIFFMTSKQDSRKISFLTGAFVCFFLSDIIGSFHSLLFFNEGIGGFMMLELGFFCIALMFFYMYCTSPMLEDLLEKERLI